MHAANEVIGITSIRTYAVAPFQVSKPEADIELGEHDQKFSPPYVANGRTIVVRTANRSDH